MNCHGSSRDILPTDSLPRLSGGGRFGKFINHSIHPCLAGRRACLPSGRHEESLKVKPEVPLVIVFPEKKLHPLFKIIVGVNFLLLSLVVSLVSLLLDFLLNLFGNDNDGFIRLNHL